jgi:hypothetical protein
MSVTNCGEVYLDRGGENMTLPDFVSTWNGCHEDVTFSISEMPGGGVVKISYPVLVGLSPDHKEWYSLNNTSKLTSHGTMLISSTEAMFEQGFIEMKIESQGKVHDEFVITTLAWIGEKLIPKCLR